MADFDCYFPFLCGPLTQALRCFTIGMNLVCSVLRHLLLRLRLLPIRPRLCLRLVRIESLVAHELN